MAHGKWVGGVSPAAWRAGIALAGALLGGTLAGCQTVEAIKSAVVQETSRKSSLAAPAQSGGAKAPDGPGGKQQTGASTTVAAPGTGHGPKGAPKGKHEQAILAAEAEFDRDQALSDITRADGSVCRAVADGGFFDTAGQFVTLTAKLLTSGLIRHVQSNRIGNRDLKKVLDEVRPVLRQIARHTLWLPVQTERLIGTALLAQRNVSAWQPNPRDQKLIDEEIMPVFRELERFAREEVRSDLTFELRLIKDDISRSPEVVSGGWVLIPSGMISRVRMMKDRRPVIAFMLAHEFSHALRRHKTKQMQALMVDSWTEVNEFKRVLSKDAGLLEVLTRGNIGGLFDMGARNINRFVTAQCRGRQWASSLDQRSELEADVCGSLMLHRLAKSTGDGIDPVAAWRTYVEQEFAARPKGEQDGDCRVPPSHPASQEREENLRRYWNSLNG